MLSTGVDVYESGLVGFFAVDWVRFRVRFPVLSTGVDVYESGLVGFLAVDWVRFLGKISCAVNWGRCL